MGDDLLKNGTMIRDFAENVQAESCNKVNGCHDQNNFDTSECGSRAGRAFVRNILGNPPYIFTGLLLRYRRPRSIVAVPS
jgi:hypothetical protein